MSNPSQRSLLGVGGRAVYTLLWTGVIALFVGFEGAWALVEDADDGETDPRR